MIYPYADAPCGGDAGPPAAHFGHLQINDDLRVQLGRWNGDSQPQSRQPMFCHKKSLPKMLILNFKASVNMLSK
jgi:hypothetical protein